MAQFKGTPGPWKISGNWVETDDIPIAKIINCKPGSGTYLANKQIIAAAPELLEALQNLMLSYSDFRERTGGNGDPQNPLILAALAAITKATGETK